MQYLDGKINENIAYDDQTLSGEARIIDIIVRNVCDEWFFIPMACYFKESRGERERAILILMYRGSTSWILCLNLKTQGNTLLIGSVYH